MITDCSIKINDLTDKFNKLTEVVHIQETISELKELEHFFDLNGWTDIPALQSYNKLTKKKETFENLKLKVNNAVELFEIISQENFTEFTGEVIEDCDKLTAEINSLLLENMFSGKYDNSNAILSIHAGAGGREAQDWAGMLLRMYLRWCERHNMKATILDSVEGEYPEGVKSATIEIKGENAYGLLKNEAGVHRLVRVSPFDSQNRRHTSFAAVEIIPEIDMSLEMQIDPKDLRIDYFRSSGAGGQHVNTTDSAVRIVHLPTGITVACQNERSQHQNRDFAMKVLMSKLLAIKEQEHYDEISQIQGEQKRIEWGSQIRSYIFMPYQLVKDHRTNVETSNIKAVMDGDIDAFIFKCLTSSLE